ncbi:MAG: hypothetical protein U0T73_13510 [Chitinophagales bacterium]
MHYSFFIVGGLTICLLLFEGTYYVQLLSNTGDVITQKVLITHAN